MAQPDGNSFQLYVGYGRLSRNFCRRIPDEKRFNFLSLDVEIRELDGNRNIFAVGFLKSRHCQEVEREPHLPTRYADLLP